MENEFKKKDAVFESDASSSGSPIEDNELLKPNKFDAYLVNQIHSAYEDPAYRDFETSDSTLSFLEWRIKKFNEQHGRPRSKILASQIAMTIGYPYQYGIMSQNG